MLLVIRRKAHFHPPGLLELASLDVAKQAQATLETREFV
jgi:hypothetical protein